MGKISAICTFLALLMMMLAFIVAFLQIDTLAVMFAFIGFTCICVVLIILVIEIIKSEFEE